MPVPRLFCLDTVLVDVDLRVSSLPERAGDVRASSQLITTGGGFNAMSAATRHDLAVVYAGRLGRGPFATLASRDLTSEGIETPLESNDALDCGVCVVLVEPDGERTFITAPGAESTLRASDLAALTLIEGDVALVSGYNVMYPGPAEIVLAWLASLGDDVRVAFDPAIRVMDIPEENLRQVLGRADWTLCNETEASSLTGEDDLEASVRALGERTGRVGVVVRHGGTGCTVLVKDGEPVLVDSFNVAVVDTNGAGDTHSGVFLAELTLGTDVIEAAKRGNAASAVAISVLGPASCPNRDVITDMLRRA